MGLKTDTDDAIDAFKEANRKCIEAQSSFNLSQRQLEGDRMRLQDANEKLTLAHRALLIAIGKPDDETA